MKINATTGKLTRNISDEKALCLQAVSRLIKRLVGVESHDSPCWTEAFEVILSRLSCDNLNHLEVMIESLRAGKITGELPK